MDELKIRTINNRQVLTLTHQTTGCNMLEVEAGTTGWCGGDTGHGGRTYFRISDLGGTDIDVNVKKDAYGCKSFEVMLGGDSELMTMMQALEFILDVYNKMPEMMRKLESIYEDAENRLPEEMQSDRRSLEDIGIYEIPM